MAIDKGKVRDVARLANLELARVKNSQGEWVDAEEALFDDSQLARLAHELSKILEHVAQLDSLDLEDVEPTSHGVPLPPLLRDDETATPLATERALAGAPATAGTSFVVPKVVG